MKLEKLQNINIVVITSNDQTFLLPTWTKTIKLFKKKNIFLKGIFISRKEMAGLKPKKLYLWYLKTFGIKNFFLLTAFTLLSKIIRQIRKFPSSFEDLSKKNNIPFFYIKNCEQKNFIKWIKEKKIDILLITTQDILKKKLIRSVKKGIINKHASILPNGRGILPFFWNTINDKEQGVTYHVISEKIDTGKMLLQKEIKKNISMIGFYLKVFNQYPFDIYQSLKIIYKINKKNCFKKKIVSSYNSIPKKKDFITFKKKNGKIILLRDFINALYFNK